MLRRNRNSMIVTLLTLLLLTSSCAQKSLPPGYESLRQEATALEISRYYSGLREGYIKAKQDGLITIDQFVLAVKADETFSAAWNTYLDLRREKKDTLAQWNIAISKLAIFEELVSKWLSKSVTKPAALGGGK